LQSDQHDFPVVDGQGHLIGALSLDDLREFLRDDHLSQILTARDCVRTIARLAPQSTLLEALEAFDKSDAYEVPVVSRGRLVGSLRRHDIMTTYRRALLSSTTSTPRPRTRAT
jgi:CIC family chloride channel protein